MLAVVAHDSDFRDQLLRLLLRQRERKYVPLVMFLSARHLFISLCERSAEAFHASMGKSLRLATHHVCIHASLATQLPSIEKELNNIKKEPGVVLTRLADVCETVRTASKAVEELGLAQHPVVQELRNSGLFDRQLNR